MSKTIAITYLQPITGHRFYKQCDRRVWAAFTRNKNNSNSIWLDDYGFGDVSLGELLDFREVQSEKEYLTRQIK